MARLDEKLSLKSAEQYRIQTGNVPTEAIMYVLETIV
jgi:hypothetical protein